MKKIYVHFNEKFLSVPCSKSDIFISDDLDLTEKNKLLNFIYAIMKFKSVSVDVNTTIDIKKDYELENKILEEIKSSIKSEVLSNEFLSNRFSEKLQVIIKVVLANLDPNQNQNIPLDELIDRIYKYLLSLQVYDDSPFLYPMYGSSEFSQALCRVSSVFGTIFIVNESLTIKIYNNNEYFIHQDCPRYVINIHDTST